MNVLEIRKSPEEYVKSLAQTVDAGWHNSYKKTYEMLSEWLQDLYALIK